MTRHEMECAVPAGRRVAIAGGYTAGHVNIGLEIAREYETAFGASRVLFIGAPHGFEQRLVPAAGHRLEIISGAPVEGRSCVAKLQGVWLACVATMQARRLLEASRIELVVGVGSYASAAALLAARQLGIRTALHEANEQMGAANRFASRFVDRIFLGSRSALAGLGHAGEASGGAGDSANRRVVVTGNPVRREVLECSCQLPARAPGGAVRILVTGGSLGSAFLNERVPELLEALAARGIEMKVHHQAGATDLEAVRERYRRCGIDATVESYVNTIADQYGRADFAITTAGAVTLAELAACGLSALVVPLGGAARDHQVHNAIAYCGDTGALWRRETEWSTPDLATAIARRLKERPRCRTLPQRARESTQANAARKLVENCESMMMTPR